MLPVMLPVMLVPCWCTTAPPIPPCQRSRAGRVACPRWSQGPNYHLGSPFLPRRPNRHSRAATPFGFEKSGGPIGYVSGYPRRTTFGPCWEGGLSLSQGGDCTRVDGRRL